VLKRKDVWTTGSDRCAFLSEVLSMLSTIQAVKLTAAGPQPPSAAASPSTTAMAAVARPTSPKHGEISRRKQKNPKPLPGVEDENVDVSDQVEADREPAVVDGDETR